MAQTIAPTFAFNRGIVSPLAQGRIDLERLAISAEIQRNWIPRSLGPMSLRPGFKLIVPTRDDGAEAARYIPFVFSTSDVALIELTDSKLRVLVDDEVVSTPASDTAMDGTDVEASWTEDDDDGIQDPPNLGSVFFGTDMTFKSNGYEYAVRYQEVALAPADVGKRHSLLIEVELGDVELRVGSTENGFEYIHYTGLKQGTHWISFTPTDDFFVEFRSALERQVRISSVELVTGDLEVSTPWASANLDDVRYEQSGDVLFIACDGVGQYRIERRGDASWSVVKYLPSDGPFRRANSDKGNRLTFTPDALTSSQPFFDEGHVGALFRCTFLQQRARVFICGEDEWSEPIKITGSDDARRFNAQRITVAFTGTINVQRSFGIPGEWLDVPDLPGTPTTSPYVYAGDTDSHTLIDHNDGFDTEVVYYRIGCKAGDYTSGTCYADISTDQGTTTAVFRVVEYVSPTQVVVQVLTEFGDGGSTSDWEEGEWSDYRGFPTAVALHEGRLWWAGRNKYWGSISDGYEEFSDDDDIGDAGPVIRSIGRGPVDKINWLAPLTRLTVGTEGSEQVIRSSSIDEVLTPTNNAIKPASTEGSASVAAVIVDAEALYVHRSGTRVFSFGPASDGISDYGSLDMTLLAPEVCEPGIVRLAVQRKPDTRVHCVRSDGTAAVFIYSKLENVRCWVTVDMAEGYEIVDVVILPGGIEDAVYYLVHTPEDTYYLTRWALESECRGDALNKQADLFVEYSGAATDTLSGLDHFPDGTELVVWADGADLGTFEVDGGEIELPDEYQNIVAGLGYDAIFKNTRLSRSLPELYQRKKIESVGLAVYKTHENGVTYGPDEDKQDELPDVEFEEAVSENRIWQNAEFDLIEFNGEWLVDPRIVLMAHAPRPCTVLGMNLVLRVNAK